MSALGPVDLPLWQTVNCARNFMFQYNFPPKIVTIYNKYPQKRSLEVAKRDGSRKIGYLLVERLLNKWVFKSKLFGGIMFFFVSNRDGINGRDCMLRTICEVADMPLSHNGLVGELLQVFFTYDINFTNHYYWNQKFSLTF